MAQSIEDALAQAEFYSDGVAYRLVQLPARAITAAAGVVAEIGGPFCALIADRDEVSLMLAMEALQEFAYRLPGYRANETSYRLITIDVALEPSLVGFMARISHTLAEAGVPIFPYAAYRRDHLFVPEADFERAMDALKKLKVGK